MTCPVVPGSWEKDPELHRCSWAGLWRHSDASLGAELSRPILLKLQPCSGASNKESNFFMLGYLQASSKWRATESRSYIGVVV